METWWYRRAGERSPKRRVTRPPSVLSSRAQAPARDLLIPGDLAEGLRRASKVTTGGQEDALQCGRSFPVLWCEASSFGRACQVGASSLAERTMMCHARECSLHRGGA